MWSVEKPAEDCGLGNDADVALNPRPAERRSGRAGMRARLLVSSSIRKEKEKASGKDDGQKKKKGITGQMEGGDIER